MTLVETIGAGIGATVSKVITKDGQVLAKKVEFNKLFIFQPKFEFNTGSSKKVLNIRTSVSDFQKYRDEIEAIKKCDSQYVIKTYGACYSQQFITLFLEHMNIGSFDVVLYRLNRVPERVLSPITRHVIHMIYLLS